jgi:hypothetical protein
MKQFSGNPLDAVFPGYDTGTLSNGHTYFIGVFEIGLNGNYYPALLRNETDGRWVVIDWRQPIQKDYCEGIDPIIMMNLIVDDFNITLAREMSGITAASIASWLPTLAEFHSVNLRMVGDRVSFTI